VPHDVRKAKERQELFKKTHFQVGEIGARPLSSDAWNFQSQATLNNPRTLAQQEISQEDMEIIRSIEADCGPAMDWTSGIQEMMMPDGQQSYEPCAPLSFVSVAAVEDAFDSFPIVVDPTTEKRPRGRTAHAYSEWCIAMSYYMFKYVTHDSDTICTKTGINKTCLIRLKQSDCRFYANYKAKFQEMSESELKDHISTLEVKKYIPLKLKSLTFFDIVEIWNLFLQSYKYAQINEKLQIPISTIQAICKRQRHNRITNYFPVDRLLDVQWFQIHWPKEAIFQILNTNIAALTQFTDTFLTSHPEFKAVYDKRKKVNFVILHEQKYCNLSSSEKSSKSLFPTLSYQSDWNPLLFPTPVQTDSDDTNEPDTQLNETVQHLDIPALQSGDALDDSPETNMDTGGDDPNTQVNPAQPTEIQEVLAEPRDPGLLPVTERAQNVKIDEHCYALSYYMSIFEHKGFTEIIQATGISHEALKRLLSDNPRFCTTVKTKIKSMSKLELETYISNSKKISYKFFNRQSTTFDTIVTIWNMRLEKMSFTEISRRINLPIPTVNYICIGKRQSKITQYFPLDRRLDPSWFEMHWTELSKSCIVINHSVTQMNFVTMLLDSHPEFKAVQMSRLAAGLSTEIHTGPLDSSSLPLFPTSGYSPSCISVIKEMLMNMPAMTEKDPLVYIKIQPEPQPKIPRLQHGGTEMFEDHVMTTEELRVDLAQPSVDSADTGVDPAENSVDMAESSVDPLELSIGLAEPIFDLAEPSIDFAEPNVDSVDQNEPAEPPPKKPKRKYNRYEKKHDKYTICYAYYLKKILKHSAKSISETTGIDYHLIYILHNNKSLLYSDYINEIKDMSKEELEQFLRELQNPQ
jgi:DNA-binding phage protein